MELYKFTTDGLKFKVREEWIVASFMSDLLTGKHKIIKLPWQPTKGDEYFKPGRDFTNAVIEIWENTAFDFALKEAGMIFKTKAECEAATAGLQQKYLGGDDNVINLSR